MPKDDSSKKKVEVAVAVMQTEINYIKETQEEHGRLLKDIHAKIDNATIQCAKKEEIKGALENFVSKDEFSPVQKIAYGMVGFILLAVLAIIIKTSIGG